MEHQQPGGPASATWGGPTTPPTAPRVRSGLRPLPASTARRSEATLAQGSRAGGQRGRMPPKRRPAASVLRRPAAAPYPVADPTRAVLRAIGAALIAAAEAAAPPGAAPAAPAAPAAAAAPPAAPPPPDPTPYEIRRFRAGLDMEVPDDRGGAITWRSGEEYPQRCLQCGARRWIRQTPSGPRVGSCKPCALATLHLDPILRPQHRPRRSEAGRIIRD